MSKYFRIIFQSGQSKFEAENIDEAFECFTNVLNTDLGYIAAMEYRAKIHFNRQEYRECVIECEEILKIDKDCKSALDLLNEAKQNIPKKRSWFQILGVLPNASKNEVVKAYRKLAKIFSPNTSKNSRLNKLDKRKVDEKMSEINEAKTNFDDSIIAHSTAELLQSTIFREFQFIICKQC